MKYGIISNSTFRDLNQISCGIFVTTSERKVNFAISQATKPEANGHTDA